MGNFIEKNLLIGKLKQNHLSEIKKKFIESNVIDKEKHIVIGIWNNPDRMDTSDNQGIWIGDHNEICENKGFKNKINKLTFGMSNLSYDVVILYFENNIKLKIYKDSTDSKLYYSLNIFKNEYKSELEQDILNNIEKIDNCSPDIDLVFYLVTKNKF